MKVEHLAIITNSNVWGPQCIDSPPPRLATYEVFADDDAAAAAAVLDEEWLNLTRTHG